MKRRKWLILGGTVTALLLGVCSLLGIVVVRDIDLAPGARLAVPTGIAIELPLGAEAQVRPRSGLALNHGITCLNSPGAIDSDYRGEIKAILINHGDTAFKITRGMKIAQMVIARHEQAELVEVESLSDSERGAGGFGSTGMKVKA